jgi:hypothetical protein
MARQLTGASPFEIPSLDHLASDRCDSGSPPPNAQGKRPLETIPLLIVYISLDTQGPRAHNPACFTGRYSLRNIRFTRTARLKDAISARMDGAVFDSGMSRARPLASRAGRAAGDLQQLRRTTSQRAATARAALSHAPASTGELSPGAAPALNLPHGSGWIVSVRAKRSRPRRSPLNTGRSRPGPNGFESIGAVRAFSTREAH